MEFNLTFNRKKIRVILKRGAIFLFVFGLVAWWWHEPKADWPGRPAPDEPRQDKEHLPVPFEYKEHQIIPLANYSITGVVLSRSRYRFDRGAVLSPIDIGMGWGRLSEAAIIQ
ncbi:MAG: hypothetical protein LBV12_03685 [Puniceicoccales bacterium]|jgi:hypothetical protein|nr:hypothetical protein [Puniceicoccales bacterium]